MRNFCAFYASCSSFGYDEPVYAVTVTEGTNSLDEAMVEVPQAFGWGWLKRKETKGQRAPTQKEMANMTWQSIAGGANGIIYYAYQHLSEPHEDPNDDFEHAWARTKAVAAEVKKYEDVLLSAGATIGISGTTEDVAARTWRCGNDAYLLVVNCTTNAQSVILTLSERTGMPSAVDLGPGPIVDDGKLRFNLAPIDYTMVRLPVTSGPDAKQPVLSACPASEYGRNLDLKPSGDRLGALNLDGSRQG